MFSKEILILNTKHEIIDLSNCIIDDINFDLISLKNIKVDTFKAKNIIKIFRHYC